MSFGNIGAYACQRIQNALFDYYGKNIAQFRTFGNTSTLKWLLSPQNTAGFRKISDDIQGVPGKKRGVVFDVDLPYCFSLCALDRACTVPPQTMAPATQQLTWDLTNPPFRHCDAQGKPVVLFFDEADLMKYCTTTDYSWIENQITRYLFRWEEALDEVVLHLLLANVGKNYEGESVTKIPLWVKNTTTNTSAINPEAIFHLDQTMQDIGVDTQYAIIGGKMINKINKFLGWTAASDAGIDLSRTDNVNPWSFYDRNVDSILGTQDFLQIAPGTAQLVTWNKFVGEKYREVTNLYTKKTLTLPRTGLQVDTKWSYDYECEQWKFEAFLTGELAVVPAGGCGTPGVNNIIQIHDCSSTTIDPVCPA